MNHVTRGAWRLTITAFDVFYKNKNKINKPANRKLSQNKFCNFRRTVAFKFYSILFIYCYFFAFDYHHFCDLNYLALNAILGLAADNLSLNTVQGPGNEVGNIHFIWGSLVIGGTREPRYISTIKRNFEKKIIKREQVPPTYPTPSPPRKPRLFDNR